MNKFEKALHIATDHSEDYPRRQRAYAYSVLKELCDKATPTKLIGGFCKCGSCPNSIDYNFCPNCGQAFERGK